MLIKNNIAEEIYTNSFEKKNDIHRDNDCFYINHTKQTLISSTSVPGHQSPVYSRIPLIDAIVANYQCTLYYCCWMLQSVQQATSTDIWVSNLAIGCLQFCSVPVTYLCHLFCEWEFEESLNITGQQILTVWSYHNSFLCSEISVCCINIVRDNSQFIYFHYVSFCFNAL